MAVSGCEVISANLWYRDGRSVGSFSPPRKSGADSTEQGGLSASYTKCKVAHIPSSANGGGSAMIPSDYCERFRGVAASRGCELWLPKLWSCGRRQAVRPQMAGFSTYLTGQSTE